VGLVLIFLTFLFWPSNYDSSSEKVSSNDSFSDVEEFHFDHMPLTYSINVNSRYYSEEDQKYVRGDDTYEIGRIKLALSIIENSTERLIRFKEVSELENPDIKIQGFPPNDESSEGGFVVEGLAGPSQTEDNTLLQSEVNLYPTAWGNWVGQESFFEQGGWLWKSTEYEFSPTVSWAIDDCKDFPNTEVHEILHALGIDHTYENSHSIMFPIKYLVQACKTSSIDKNIISCLKYIYSNGTNNESCQNTNLYPWPEENDQPKEDFKWDRLPITYNMIGCNDNQKWNIQKAENLIEKYLGYNLYEFKEFGLGDINFYCEDSFDNVLLNEETDFWDTGIYFPAAQPYYEVENGRINHVKIILFAEDKRCGGIEVHEFLHGAGLRKHYGPWMNQETGLCNTNTLVLGPEAINKIKEIYSLE